MAIYSQLIIFFVVIFSSSSFTKPTNCFDDKDFGSFSMCNGNSTKGNPLYYKYESSVMSLLSDLPLEPQPQIPRFRNTSFGSGAGKAYGSYICWGDVSPKLCHRCVVYTTQDLARLDFYQDCFAFGSYLDSHVCLVHYSNESVSVYKKGLVMSMGKIGGKVANYKEYNQTLSTTIQGLIKEAAIGNWTTTNLVTKIVPVVGSEHEKIHILAQCIPVISAKNCSSCLSELYDFVPGSCNGTQGGFVEHANCMMTFNNQTFLGGAIANSNGSHINFCLIMLFFISFLIFV